MAGGWGNSHEMKAQTSSGRLRDMLPLVLASFGSDCFLSLSPVGVKVYLSKLIIISFSTLRFESFYLGLVIVFLLAGSLCVFPV